MSGPSASVHLFFFSNVQIQAKIAGGRVTTSLHSMLTITLGPQLFPPLGGRYTGLGGDSQKDPTDTIFVAVK